MDAIRAICFDLDDTLWDLGPVLPRAEAAVYAWLEACYPEVTRRYSMQDIRDMRATVAADYPRMAHDLGALRHATFARLASRSGYAAALADEAYEVFQAARNEVTLYADVVPALAHLLKSHRLLALTNGNADLGRIGIAGYFQAVFTAAELGAAKPAREVFMRVCERTALQPQEILHIGNNPEHDVAAAAAIGMCTVWINRDDADWPLQDTAPDHVVRDLRGLVQLLGL